MFVLVKNEKKLKVFIENFAGDLRHGKDWIQKMANDYGYIIDTVGTDGDAMDCFIGPSEDSDSIYIVEQNDEAGDFDEHKIMIGFNNLAEAKEAYHANYPDGWNGFRNISEIRANEFWQWYEGLAGNKNVVVTKKDKDTRKKLVQDEEGLAGRPDFTTEKENTMIDTYRVGTHNRDELIDRGKHTYGSKVDNSTCECPDCYGGGRLGLFQCKNCKGTGKIKNEKDCPDCGGTGDGSDNMPCKTCKATGRVSNSDGTGKVKNANLKDGVDSLKETDTSKNPNKEGESHTGPFFEEGDATHRKDGDDIEKHNAKLTKSEAMDLFEEYARKFDPEADPDKQEVWQLNKIKQWLRGSKGLSSDDANFCGNVWMDALGA